MGQLRDEHAKQHDAQAVGNDTDLMVPGVESSARMTGQGAIPPVQGDFAAPGPTASDRAYGSYLVVTASTLNVRSSPSTESKANIVGKLQRGAKVAQYGTEGDWVKIEYRGQSAYVHHNYVAPVDTRPSAEASAEVMKDFREVNGDDLMEPSAETGRGKPPSAADSAEVMNDFREVNGDVGRGKPPSAESSAEVMQIFREVNGDELMAPGRGKPPSAADSADVMNDFREVNGDVGRGRPPSAESSAEVMQMFREVNEEPATKKPTG